MTQQKRPCATCSGHEDKRHGCVPCNGAGMVVIELNPEPTCEHGETRNCHECTEAYRWEMHLQQQSYEAGLL